MTELAPPVYFNAKSSSRLLFLLLATAEPTIPVFVVINGNCGNLVVLQLPPGIYLNAYYVHHLLLLFVFHFSVRF